MDPPSSSKAGIGNSHENGVGSYSPVNSIPAADSVADAVDVQSGVQQQKRRQRKVKIDAMTEKNDTEDSDGNEMSPAGVEGEPVFCQTQTSQYERLKEEHVEAVVILKNGMKRDDLVTGLDEMEALLKSNGKLTFNLTSEQLGNVAAGCSVSVDGKTIPRKSSLRRNSLYNNQSDLEKQFVMDQPKPLPETAGMFDAPKRILMPMFSEEQDGLDMENFFDKKADLKFDEILTVYDQFPTDFLPSKYKCGMCNKLCQEPRVLDCLHTFCKRCLIELEANSHSGSNLFWRRINECANFDWDCKAS